ncbi:site-specific integrase [Bacillus sp. FSL W8-0223]|uniref:site-specific integrase n=1 Tax=Bacillus sp. FSL W8-0223 TaxID=2954595 RepID=UPI0030F73864
MATFYKYKRKGSNKDFWEYRIVYKDPKTGKYKEKSKKGFTSKAEAKLAAEEMENKLGLGIDIQKEDMLVKDYLQEWFENNKKNTVSWGTEKTILQAINLCIENLGYVRMKDLDRSKYQSFINKIAPYYSKSTLQRHNSRLSEAFEQAVQDDIIRKNPVWKIKIPKTVRIGEITALYEEDIDLNNKVVDINKTFVRENRIWLVKETTKTGESGERRIGLDDYTVEKMKEWKKIRNEILVRLGLRNVPYFFINQKGEFIKTVNYGDMLRTICKRHGLRHMTPHMFRHTHETIMWESGIVDLNFIGARLGDKDKTILLNTYGHLSNRSEQMNMDKINQFMKSWAVFGQ